MARQKLHPNVGKFIAMFEHHESAPSDETPTVFDTAEEALAYTAVSSLDDGDVVYVYAVVGVKVVRKPTLSENYAA